MKNNLKSVHIIGETACAHDGYFHKLIKMIDSIGSSGANSIQFRVFNHQNTITKNHPDFKKIKKLVLNKREWINCFNYTRKKYPKLEIISSVPSTEELMFSNNLNSDAFKIHSADLDNFELIEAASKIGKRIDLSVGASSITEIKNAVNLIKKINSKCKIWLMYGYQLFPTKPERLDLKKIFLLQKIFKLNTGYQDHSSNDEAGFAIPTLAIGLGVKIIEKHITDDLSRRGTDSASAIDCKNFGKFVQICNEAHISIGNGKFGKFSSDENKYRKYCKKNLFLSKDIDKNSIITNSDLILRRSHKIGIIGGDKKKIIGKKIKKKLNKFDQLFLKHIY